MKLLQRSIAVWLTLFHLFLNKQYKILHFWLHGGYISPKAKSPAIYSIAGLL